MGKHLFESRVLLTNDQMRALEGAAMRAGLATGAELMERAGCAVAGEIRLRWPKPGRATVLCGPGNNGGDGYVIARALHEAGWRISVLGPEGRASGDAAEMREAWRKLGPIRPLTVAALRAQESDLYVDAIFGTGLTRAPEGEIAAVLSHLAHHPERFGGRLIAVDCPSGLCLDSGRLLMPGEGAPARLTVSFDSPRPGHFLALGPELCGELVIADIGLGKLRAERLRAAAEGEFAQMGGPRLAQDTGDSPDAEGLARRLGKAAHGHKFSHGHALILAGGRGKGGAARLSARAALRIGAGLVSLAPPAEALSEHLSPPDALMRRGIDGAEDLAVCLTDPRITAILLGPGSGVARAALLLPAVLGARRGTVLDADALTALAQREDPFDGLHADCVLTPHLGEFARLFPDLAAQLRAEGTDRPPQGRPASKLEAVREAAERSGATILLKGPDTVIAAPGGAVFLQASSYDAAAPWLATAGSGDVLAGIITGLLARGFSAPDAARMGAALHGAAARRFGPGLIADDLPEELPGVLREIAGG